MANERVCEECEGAFTASSSRARFCSARCKQRAHRKAKRAARAEDPTPPPAPKPAKKAAAPKGSAEGDPTSGQRPKEDPLVTAVKRELGTAGQRTVDGQIALHLARQVKAAVGSQASSLAKELRATLDRVAASTKPPPPPQAEEETVEPEPEDDEVTKARKLREDIAAAAAEAG